MLAVLLRRVTLEIDRSPYQQRQVKFHIFNFRLPKQIESLAEVVSLAEVELNKSTTLQDLEGVNAKLIKA